MAQKSRILLVIGIFLAFGSPLVNAIIVDNELTGNTSYDGWDSLGLVPGYGFGTSWESPLGSFEAGSGDAALDRLSGTHYSASVSLYSFGANSVFSVVDSNPLAGLETIVFSIETWLAGDENTGPLALPTVPTLNYNGGSQSLVDDNDLKSVLESQRPFDGNDFQNLLDQNDFINVGVNTVPFGGNDLGTVVYTFQWDVTGLGITEFNIDWEHQVHSGVVGLQLEQSDIYSVAAASVIAPVPVPGAILLFGSSLVGLFGSGLVKRRKV